MARKTVKKKKKDLKRENKEMWMIICLFLIAVIIFATAKMGKAGLFLHNLFVYIGGSLYVIGILIAFFYGIYRIFFPDDETFSKKRISGLIVLNLFFVLLGAYIADETRTISE